MRRWLRVMGVLAVGLATRDGRPDPVPTAAPAAPTSDRAANAIEAAARSIPVERSFGGASIGIEILDLESGRVLAAVNEHAALRPASNAKIYTAGAALATLRGSHRYETTFAGKLEGDTVRDFTIRGYGDPSLTTADLWAMVKQLTDYGVKRVIGDIRVDQRFYDEQTTPPAFEQQPNEWASFRAPVSAVAVDENCLTMTVRPSTHGGAAHVDFDPPGLVDVEGTVRTAESGGADTVELALAGSGSRMTAKVSGAISPDSKLVRYTRRTEDPRLLAGYVTKALFDKSGIEASGDIKLGTIQGHTLVRHESAPLSSLLYALGKQSDNFYAEMIFKSLGGETKGHPATSASSTEVVAQWLAEIGAADAGVVIKNGSGLFDADVVTASSIVQVLRWAWREPKVQPEYLAQLSVGGVDGTLRKRFRSARTLRRVRAKTGTLDDVISLSGYVMRDGGRGPIAFSILFNHVGGKQDSARHAADRLVDTIAKYAEGEP